jgi:hypothetical protein
MKERPILFSGPMVRALLDGSKTQTRRVMKEKHLAFMDGVNSGRCTGPVTDICPYGQVGDKLWVREAFNTCSCGDIDETAKVYRATFIKGREDCCPYCFTPIKFKPSIHMPRWASRISLEITEVRVQRLNDISEADALAEGIRWPDKNGRRYQPPIDLTGFSNWRFAADQYAELWDSINGPGAWALNPLVWCVSFKMVKP